MFPPLKCRPPFGSTTELRNQSTFRLPERNQRVRRNVSFEDFKSKHIFGFPINHCSGSLKGGHRKGRQRKRGYLLALSHKEQTNNDGDKQTHSRIATNYKKACKSGFVCSSPHSRDHRHLGERRRGRGRRASTSSCVVGSSCLSRVVFVVQKLSAKHKTHEHTPFRDMMMSEY